MQKLILTLIVLIGMDVVDAGVVGYRGDRNGYYAGCRPPASFAAEGDKTKNLRWKTEMPNWGLGSPITVGDRVFVMSEPGWKSDWPELLCLDLATGKMLWKREINHLPHIIDNERERKKVADTWHNYFGARRRAKRLQFALKHSQDEQERSKALEQAKALKLKVKGNQIQLNKQGHDYVLPDPEFGGKWASKNQAEKYGLRLETYCGTAWAKEGEAFSTPCSDGKRVYVVTEQGTPAC